ncbi:hypothetical protein J3D55_003555 [Chryseobacterium ginsenosidimutans]|nr:hypothetical protein [Chryseobacterium ginsenosidimutans]
MAGKIIGNQNPVVGIKYEYEINTFASILMGGFGSFQHNLRMVYLQKGKK